MGAAVAAAAAGRVATAGHSGEYGNLVVLEHGSGLATSYAHLLHIAVAEGDCIAAGQIVGQVGATGLAAQPLLHFEVRRNGTAVDPASLIPELR
jgi:murein DD-endopeptidase MepM/ murein hydrolase activator NlpD